MVRAQMDPPVPVTQPVSQTNLAGSTVTFQFVAGGTEPLVYQWYFQGTNVLVGATNSSLILAIVQADAAGDYLAVVTNNYGAITSVVATLTIRVPPYITVQPLSQFAAQGNNVSLFVIAKGDSPLAFQWSHDGNLVMDATNATLNLTNVQPADSGGYSIVVVNDWGSITSAVATLTVRIPPTLSLQPTSLVATQGDNAMFSVAAAGDSPLTFQWRRNGTVLVGATNTSLLLSNVQLASAGNYSVVVTNIAGSITSAPAALTVIGLDFGDAPDALYPTLFTQNGARHVVVPGFGLGAVVTPDSDGQPSPDASGDADDGVLFVGPLRVGQPASLQVIASTNGFLNAWLDFNQANGWADSGEQLFTNRALVPGTNLLGFVVPGGAATGQTFARFRFSTATNLTPAGLAPDGEVEDYAVSIAPASDLALGVTTPLPLVPVGALAAFTINVTNLGPSPAAGVTLVSQLSPVTQFLSASTTAGVACTNVGGVVTCVVSNLNPNGRFTVTLNVTAGAGTNRCASSVTAGSFDLVSQNNAATALTVATHSLVQYTSADPIVFDEFDENFGLGPGSIYPSTINVSGLTSQVFKVTVSLLSIDFSYPDDLDILLVGPGGQRVLLMSDCGLDNALSDVTITFDDDAATLLPDSDPPIVTGTYKPSNYGGLQDVMNPPAPPPPYSSQLLVFRGTNPNGTWSLYARDDQPVNGGIINNGWSLSIVTSDPIADLAIGQTANVATLPAGSNLFYTILVTNRGPADARATVTDTLPASVNFVSAIPTQGSCTYAAGVVTCDLGNLLSGATRQIVVVVSPTLGGTMTNQVSVTGNQVDLNLTNNTAAPLVTTVLAVADVGVTASAAPQPSLLAQPILYTLLITNRGPSPAANVVLTNTLPVQMTVVSATPSQGACTNNGGLVTCSLGALASGGSAIVTISGRSGVLGVNSNFVHVAAGELDFISTNNDAEVDVLVQPDADFQLIAAPAFSNVLLGQNWNYILILSNRGPSTSSASLSTVLPASVQFISATPSQGSCSNGPGGLVCQFDSMAAGQQASVTVVTRPTALSSLTNVITATGALPDPDGSNNGASVAAIVLGNADLDLRMTDVPDPVWLGENVTYFITLTNRGPNLASGVSVSNTLPTGFNYISSSATKGACSRAGDTVFCNIGTLNAGSGVSIVLFGRPPSAGLATNTARAELSEPDPDARNNVTSQVTRVIAPSGIFSSVAPITIPSVGAATPYPSTILVSGLTASVFRVRVSLTNLAHTYPDDLDMLLVGPEGQSVMLMSDAGGELAVTNVTLTFDADALVTLPDSGPLFSGIVLPADYEAGADALPPPAPPGPYSTNLAVFQDTNPNGPWSLYVLDDASKDSGLIAGGWSLAFSTLEPIADLLVVQQLSANPAAVSNHLIITCLVTNRGPAIATGVQLTNVLDPSLAFVSVASTTGSCTNSAGTILCNLGSLASGASAIVTIDTIPPVAKTFTNRVTIAGAQRDLHPENNVSEVILETVNPPIITLQPVGMTVTNGDTVAFLSAVSGSAPLFLQWQRNGINLPGATNNSLTLTNVTPFDSGGYRLWASNRVATAFSTTAVLRVLGPPSISEIPDQVIDEDTSTGVLPFMVDDAESPPQLIHVTGQSSNTNLVLSTNIVITGAGSDRAVQVTPLPNANGQATISILAEDPDGGVTTRTFLLTVRPVNDPPAISHTADQSTPEDTPLVIQFLANDLETAPGNLGYSIRSTNPTLIPTNAVVFGGTNSTRTARFSPATNQFGTASITLQADDGAGGTASDTFVITVVPVNDPPTLDPVTDLVVGENSGPRSIVLTGITSGATNEFQNLQIAVQSGNPALIPAPGIAYTNPANTAILTFVPSTNATGTALITITVTDGGQANQSFIRLFTVTVVPSNAAPVISMVASVSSPEDVALRVAVSLSDPDDAAGTLTLSATSLNTNLVQNSGLAPGGSGAMRSFLITPVLNATGTVAIQFVAADPLGSSSTNVLTLTLLPVNDVPTLDVLTNLTIVEDAGTQSVALTGISSGAANENQTLVLSAASSNLALIPAPNIVYTSPNPSGTLTFRPNTNATGIAIITVTVDDGAGGVVNRAFTVTVTPANDPPTIPAIADQSTIEDTPIVISFTVLDVDTPLPLLTLSGSSSNASLVVATNIVFDGGGSNRTVTIRPQPNQSGVAGITLFVSDGFATNSTTFQLTVTATNDPPTINPIPNFVTNSASGNPMFVIPINGITSGATNENQLLTITTSSSNPGVIPSPAVSYTSPNTNGTITLHPGNNATGSAIITVTVSDGSSSNSQSFVASIKAAANVVPTLSIITSQSTTEDTPTAPIPFTVRDAETPATNLTVTAVSSNPLLLPVSNISFTGLGTNRNVILAPASNQTGVAAITLTVTDGGFGLSNMTFTLTVVASNDIPSISAITNRTTPEETLLLVPFTVGDVETAAGALAVSATSSNLLLVPNANLIVGGSGSNRVLMVTPATNQTGTATIVVRVSDGAATNSSSFVLTVSGVNDPPLISGIPDLTTPEDTPVGPVPFVVQDLETAPGALTLSAVSSNPSLVSTSNITFGGSTSNRTLTITPQTNASGTAVITITVSDGSGSASTAFLLTVSPVNDPPTLGPIADVRVNQNSEPRTVALSGIGAGAGESSQVVAVTASTPDSNLIRVLGVSYSGGSTGLLTLQPVPGVSGTGTVTVTVIDGEAASNVLSRSFSVVVNSAPTIAYVPDQTTLESTPGAPILIAIGDLESPVGQLTLGFTPAVPLLPSGSASFSGTNSVRTLILTPAAGLTGTVLATVTVTDPEGASSTSSFYFTVTHSNRPPTIDPIPNQVALEDVPITVPITIGDLETPAASLTVTGYCSSALVPAANIQFGGSGSNRTLTLLGLTNASGSATMIVAVTDGMGLTTSNTFGVLIQPVLDLITILTQPQGATVPQGSQATFTCIAQSGVPWHYQWERNSVALPGATGSTLVLSNVQPADAGAFRCLVTNDDAAGLYSTQVDLVVLGGAQILSITRTGAVATLRYLTFTGSTNTIEFKPVLSGTNWNPLSPVVATGAVMTVPDPNATNATRFYRVRTDF